MAKTEGVTIQSVVKAAKILDILLKKGELGISDISAEMSISKSTAYGIVNTLAETGFIEQDSPVAHATMVAKASSDAILFIHKENLDSKDQQWSRDP